MALLRPQLRALLSILLIATFLALTGCELGYVIRQGVHQAHLLSQRRPVEAILTDPSVDPQIKERILLVQRVRTFGAEHLGLEPTDAYSSYIEVPGDAVVYVLSACPKDRLDPYLWRFPLVGRFPYKGFFHLKSARQEKHALEKEGYDTHLAKGVAFSALGWFSDPLYSSMLRMDEIGLIYTILHEMVHGTVFFSDQVDFNEKLATFVGWQGTVAFLIAMHGRESAEANRGRQVIEDERLVAEFLEWAHGRLSAFYARALTPHEKVARRGIVFAEIVAALRDLIPKLHTDRFDVLQRLSWNNASLLARWRYRYDAGSLGAFHARLGGDLRAMVTEIRAWQENGEDPFEALERTNRRGRPRSTHHRWCASPSP